MPRSPGQQLIARTVAGRGAGASRKRSPPKPPRLSELTEEIPRLPCARTRGPGTPPSPVGGRAGGSVSRLFFPPPRSGGRSSRRLTEGPLRAGCGRRRLLDTHLPPVRREGRRGAGKGRGGTGRSTAGRAFPSAGRGLAVREGGGGGPRSGREVLGLPLGPGDELEEVFQKVYRVLLLL